MRQLERMQLISSIAYELQQTMNTTSINIFLSGFGIECAKVSIVASKRVYVEKLLVSTPANVVQLIAIELGIVQTSPAVTDDLEKYLRDQGYRAAEDDFERARAFIERDPEQAIGSASAILESICKGILERMDKPLPKDMALRSLVRSTYKIMNLSPEDHADSDIKQILGGITNAATGIGVLRTKYSSFHGRTDSQKQYRLTARHARLAVGCAAVLGCFLIETYSERFRESHINTSA
ncbi:hypothetical protein Lepto7376_3448 [[Leptolyngbya] sp. PCC 7376]|uniref:abortive infection family protein n=1 Tax=[Leptolyngbya] sp. PCC 7376 TaxID=111781 RepID=UPI00029F26F6|nr:abortive infection family protein [[Leptolyngbya] sp. PCC 7376]AFY39651.1 hypothetical protein Lepto7376_3448 [[Leptolyngbya] sp. PCC 7376]